MINVLNNFKILFVMEKNLMEELKSHLQPEGPKFEPFP
jgi:hypothetical protein